jgi:ribosomal protein S12 methylthiotransferase
MISRLRLAGYERVSGAADADIIIVNTCGFIEAAKRESLDAVFSARAAYPRAKIVMAGCLAERYAKDFKENLPEADIVCGLGDILGMGYDSEIERGDLLSLPGSAYVKIGEGCDNRCSFCAIPNIRGPHRPRKIEDITREIAALAARGIREINLVAQDIASFMPLSGLLDSISRLEGNFWLRMLYMHPDNFPRDILERVKSDARILPYFDIPFQSGSDSIIRAMNRKGSAESYAALIETIRGKIDGRQAVFRTTFLAGFPGETERDAELTREFLRKIEPDWSGVFTYSREEGTAAYSMKGRVSKKTAAARAKILEDIQAGITEKKLAAHIGKTYDALVEETIRDGSERYAVARTWFQAPEVDGATVILFDGGDSGASLLRPGTVAKVKITGVRAPGLVAEPL